MIIVFVAAKHKIDYYRRKVYNGLVDQLVKQTEDRIETDQDKWFFVDALPNWEYKLKGMRIDRLYLCRNGVNFTDDIRNDVLPQVNYDDKKIVFF